VVVHIGGSLYAGHYIAYVRSGSRWFCVGLPHQCNDSSVHPVDFRKVQNDEAYLLFYCRKRKPKTDPRADKPGEKPARLLGPNDAAPVLPTEGDSRPKSAAPVKTENRRLAALLTTAEPASNGLHKPPQREEPARPAPPALEPKPSPDPLRGLKSQLFGRSEQPATRPSERPEWYSATQDSGSLSKRAPETASQRSRLSVAPKLKRWRLQGLEHLRLMSLKAKLATLGQPVLNRRSTMDVVAGDQEAAFASAESDACLQRSKSADFTR